MQASIFSGFLPLLITYACPHACGVPPTHACLLNPCMPPQPMRAPMCASSYGIFFYNASVKGNLTALSSLTFLT